MAILGLLGTGSGLAVAATPTDVAPDEAARKKAELLHKIEELKSELRELAGSDEEDVSASIAGGSDNEIPALTISAPTPPVAETATGQTVTTVDRERFKDSPAFSIGDILRGQPGVSVKQGNGPRDVGISIRGSNARNGFAIRNIQVQEDGFAVTQPDGLSRTDITDPHAYGAVDVYKGPSSSLFGNYATGGAINFHSRSGGEIDGFEVGSDAGEYGYLNEYLTFGRQGRKYDVSAFASHVRGDGFITNQEFQTTTQNFLGSYSPSATDKFTFKFINNDLDGNLPIRLSLNQFKQNPYQKGCEKAGMGLAAGCGTVSLRTNGFTSATTTQTAEQAGLQRSDRRTIAGARWEHRFGSDTTWRTQAVFDSRDINQPTGNTSARGDFPSFNVSTDVTHKSTLFGKEATHFGGFFFNYEDNNGMTYFVRPGGDARLGGLSNTTFGYHYNVGAKAREEWKFAERWTAVLGVGAEHTDISALNTSYAYSTNSTPTITQIQARRNFFNVAPEAALLFQANQQLQLHGRVSTGYGTPQIGNLFVTSAGVNGNNTDLETQSNVGVDIGADWSPFKTVNLSVTGFYEWFENEFVTQSAGAGLLGYTFNAPKSEHRGVEMAADWRFLPDWKFSTAYTYNNQIYTDYAERLSAGGQSRVFDRKGNRIPGVEPNFVTARVGYDASVGALQGFGGFIEMNWRDSFFIDNANLAEAPSYELVNLNLHYNPRLAFGFLHGVNLFFEVDNLFDREWVASANNVANSISSVDGTQNNAASVEAATGSIYAGAPRTFIAGMRLKF